METVQDIDALLINHACTQQIHRFAALNDARDYDALAQLFIDDGEFGRPSAPDDIIVGRDAISEAFRKRPRRKSLHLVSNIVVDVISTTEAMAESLITLYSSQEGEHIAEPPYLIGRFRDRLVRRGNLWLFASRRGLIEFKVTR